jgi:hypothetical protein
MARALTRRPRRRLVDRRSIRRLLTSPEAPLIFSDLAHREIRFHPQRARFAPTCDIVQCDVDARSDVPNADRQEFAGLIKWDDHWQHLKLIERKVVYQS